MRAIAIAAVASGCFARIEVAKPAPVAATAAPFALASHAGERVVLAEVLRTHAVVLVFYRGHW